ncbi:MAG: protein serine/threonine phosphatase 2C family protein [Ruminococcus sp.]|nr:protein serine/threonine phosphatase 2C family protein [Candidatus Copronaster equi]
MKKKKDKTNQDELRNDIQTVESKESSLCITLNNGHSLKIGVAQNQGKRPYQEDSYGFSNLSNPQLIQSKGVLSVLADGMGGLSNGKQVSTMAVSGLIDYFNMPDSICSNGEQLFGQIKNVNSEVCNRFCPDGKIRAGSTLVSALIYNETLHWSCVGDSRLYLNRDGKLYQINEDHDYLNQLIEEAVMEDTDISAAFNDKQKDVLVSCIGSEKIKGDNSLNGIPLISGDRIMLCSDGIYNALPLSAINSLLNQPPQAAAENIESSVVAQGFKTQDNLTVIVLLFE